MDVWKALGSPHTAWREYVPRRGGVTNLLLLASHTSVPSVGTAVFVRVHVSP